MYTYMYNYMYMYMYMYMLECMANRCMLTEILSLRCARGSGLVMYMYRYNI